MAFFDTIRYVDDPSFEVKNKRVLVRVDFNVPVTPTGLVANDKRIREALPTIELLRKRGAKIVLMSHFGRPKGNPEPKYSLKTMSQHLAKLLGVPVHQLADSVGNYVEARTRELKPGEVLMLENVRFHERETEDPDAFGKDLAVNGDCFVNDAFGSCHRDHGSVSGIARQLPHAGGLLIRKELAAFKPLLDGPAQPYVAVLGGVKVGDKIGVIEALLEQVRALCIGGAMAYTFLKANGVPIGKSIVDEEHLDFAHDMLVEAKRRDIRIHLPEDHVVSTSITEESARTVDSIPADMAAFDIGPKTAKNFATVIGLAKSVIFNGPMGVFEKERYSSGTRSICMALAEAHGKGALVVVGGGDSAAAAEAFGIESKVSHVSTGGGASLELLEGLELPGLTALAAPDL